MIIVNLIMMGNTRFEMFFFNKNKLNSITLSTLIGLFPLPVILQAR